MKAERLVIVDGVRTPFCKMGTDLARLGADELGRIAVNALLTRTGLDPHRIDEVIFGCVGQPAEAANVARVIALRAGIPEHVPAVTVHRNCASGCEAVTQACEKMVAGLGSIFVVGGTESMSQYPLLFKQSTAAKLAAFSKAKTFGRKLGALASFRPSDFQPRIALQLGLTDPACGVNMGETAEVPAREFGLTRAEPDELALQSHRRPGAPRERLAEEICPAYLHSGVLDHDNGPRPNQTLEALAKLKPVFDRKTGTVTAGNASQITDGAVALLVMSESKANELGFTPLGCLTGYSYAGCDPSRMGLGPVFAIAKAELLTGLALPDADVVEINEAFAAQVLAVLKAMGSEKFARKAMRRATQQGTVPRVKLQVN